MEKRNNYEIAARNACAHFMKFEQQPLIDAFALRHDEGFLYLSFVAQEYRIARADGAISRRGEGGWVQADFNETLSIFDLLCHSGRPFVPYGQWAGANSLRHVGLSSNGSGVLIQNTEFEQLLETNFDRLSDILAPLCAKEVESADFSCEIPIFDTFSVQLRFYRADEEFPPQLQFFWDTNALSFAFYETLHYIMGHIQSRIEDILEAKNCVFSQKFVSTDVRKR